MSARYSAATAVRRRIRPTPARDLKWRWAFCSASSTEWLTSIRAPFQAELKSGACPGEACLRARPRVEFVSPKDMRQHWIPREDLCWADLSRAGLPRTDIKKPIARLGAQEVEAWRLFLLAPGLAGDRRGTTRCTWGRWRSV